MAANSAQRPGSALPETESTSKYTTTEASEQKIPATEGSIKGSAQRLLQGFSNYYRGPLADAHLMVTICVILSIIGLVMVLDASGPASLRDYGNYYKVFIRQCAFMALGWAGFYMALRIPFSLLRKLAFPLYFGVLLLLVMVLIPGVGQERNGAQSWFDFGAFAFQPSELAKVVIILFVALLMGQFTHMSTIGDMLKPITLFVPIILLVVLQRDLGMAVTFGVVLLAFLFFGRMPAGVISILALGAGVLFIILTLTAGFRTDRLITYWHQLTGRTYDAQGAGYQARQAMLALADGGITGVGLGQSRAKYFYLPEATNDFIFAIIGEELGLLGALFVVLLYVVLGFVGLRVARRVLDPALRMLAIVGTTSVVVQAFINMGYVVGLLPVTGLQLPLISAGGSATVTTLFLLGLIASAARHERSAIAAISTGGGRLGKMLRLPIPPIYHFDDNPDFGLFTPLADRLVGQQGGTPVASRATDPRRSQPMPRPHDSGRVTHGENSPVGSRTARLWRVQKPERGTPGGSKTPSATEARSRPSQSPARDVVPPWKSSSERGSRTLPPLERPQGRRWNPPPRGSEGGSGYGGSPKRRTPPPDR